MRKLFLFVNSGQGDWLNCLSLTDDGFILGNHICSHMRYMQNDLHARPDRLTKIKDHFKNDPYLVVILSYEECKREKDPDFVKALKLANQINQNYEQARVILTTSDGETSNE